MTAPAPTMVSNGERPMMLAPHAPVLRRGPDEVQVGVEPDRALIFTGPGYVPLLRSLDGLRTLPAVRAAGVHAGLTDAQIHSALTRLDQAGLLVDHADDHAFAGARLLMIGAGPLARPVSELLLAGGVGAVSVDDRQRPERELYPDTGARTRAEALRETVDARYRDRVLPIPDWSSLRRDRAAPPADLVLVIGNGPETDRLVSEQLVRLDQPHLIVRTSGTAATVGPLVVPGSTSCLRCHDLVRRDRDPQWPSVLAQLTRIRLSAPPVVTAWATATVVTAVLTWLSTGAGELAGATAEFGSGDLAVRVRDWPVHPECGCRWSARTEWDA